jgi:hypothetical protein
MMIMAALSPRARALVQAGRGAFRPADTDRARIEAALDARLGPGALAPDAPPAPGAARFPTAAGWHSLPRLVIGVGLLGGAAFLAFRPGGRNTVSPASHSSPAAAVASVVTPELANDPSNPTSVPPVPAFEMAPGAPAVTPPGEAPVSRLARSQDALAQEVVLLSKAASDLRAGRSGEALKALDEHQRRFPHGTLTLERRAAKAQALCALKRVSEGRAELAHLAPQSPAAARAKQVCDANAGATEKP